MFISEEEYFKFTEALSQALLEYAAALKVEADRLEALQSCFMQISFQANQRYAESLTKTLRQAGIDTALLENDEGFNPERFEFDLEKIQSDAAEWANSLLRDIYARHGIGRTAPDDVQDLGCDAA